MNNNQTKLPNPLISVIAIIPVYNNQDTLAEVVHTVKKYIPNIIVVNDGSTDDTAKAIPILEHLHMLSFEQNRGKGAALRAGFREAIALGYTHAITFDGDGQHAPEDIPAFLDKIQEQRESLWIGNRISCNDQEQKPPLRSQFGRKFGNFWYTFNTKIKLNDSQCGFRAYPLKATLDLRCKGDRYEYEQEIIIQAAWHGISVCEIPIKQYYFSGSKNVSHFRPIRDFLRISRINAQAAITRIFLPINSLGLPGNTWMEKIRALAKHELRANTTPTKAAGSVALGVFIGIFPIHLFQVITLLGLSFILPINRPLAFLGVNVSAPPLMPLLIFITVSIGKLVVPPNLINLETTQTIETLFNWGIEFVIGSIILAPIAALATYAISFPMFKRLAKLKNNFFNQTSN